MRCLGVRAQWVDKRGRREDTEENPFKEGETDAWTTCGVRGGDNACVYHNMSAPPKKRETAQTAHHRWRFDSSGCCLSPPTFTPSNRTNFSSMLFKFEPLIPVKAGWTPLGFFKVFWFHSSLYCTSQLLTIKSQSCLLLCSFGHTLMCTWRLCFSLTQPGLNFRKWVVKNSNHSTAGQDPNRPFTPQYSAGRTS